MLWKFWFANSLLSFCSSSSVSDCEYLRDFWFSLNLVLPMPTWPIPIIVTSILFWAILIPTMVHSWCSQGRMSFACYCPMAFAFTLTACHSVAWLLYSHVVQEEASVLLYDIDTFCVCFTGFISVLVLIIINDYSFTDICFVENLGICNIFSCSRINFT